MLHKIWLFFQRDKYMPPCICGVVDQGLTREEISSACLSHTLIHAEYGGYQKMMNRECNYCNFDLVKKAKEVKLYAK